MATYTIQVINRSGFTKAYTILMEPPRVNRNLSLIHISEPTRPY